MYKGEHYIGGAAEKSSGLYFESYSYSAVAFDGSMIMGEFRVSLIECLGAGDGVVHARDITIEYYTIGNSGGMVDAGASSAAGGWSTTMQGEWDWWDDPFGIYAQ